MGILPKMVRPKAETKEGMKLDCFLYDLLAQFYRQAAHGSNEAGENMRLV